mmetsp:Transcript_8901/g.13106  ORF Transcript_8901/g.13106 Transcript_8901/m.13106 type:complete len:413 (+) Transcript_8901:151-1389(+)
MIPSSALQSIQPHLVDCFSGAALDIALDATCNKDVVFITLGAASSSKKKRYNDLLKQLCCSAMHNILCVFIGTKKNDLSAIRHEIQNSSVLNIYGGTFSLAFVYDKSALISHKLRATIAPSWWGVNPTVLYSISVFLAGSEKLFPLLSGTGKWSGEYPVDDMTNYILDTLYEQVKVACQKLCMSRRNLHFIEGQYSFASLHDAYVPNAFGSPGQLPTDVTCHILSFVQDRDRLTFYGSSKSASALIDQFYLSQVAQNLNRVEYIISCITGSSDTDTSVAPGSQSASVYDFVPEFGDTRHNMNTSILSCSSIDICNEDLSSGPLDHQSLPVYNLNNRISSFQSVCTNQSLVQSSVSDASDFTIEFNTYDVDTSLNDGAELGKLRHEMQDLTKKVDNILNRFLARNNNCDNILD